MRVCLQKKVPYLAFFGLRRGSQMRSAKSQDSSCSAERTQLLVVKSNQLFNWIFTVLEKSASSSGPKAFETGRGPKELSSDFLVLCSLQDSRATYLRPRRTSY